MKDFLSKHGLSEEKPVQGTPAPLRSHPEQEQEDTKSQNSQFNRKPEEKVTKKQQQKQAKKQLPQQDKQKQQDSRKGNSKKQGSIKSMIKQVMNQIVQQRHRHTLPLELINQVSKEQPSIRLIQLFQRMHLYYFKVFDIFKKNGHHQMQQLMERFSGKILSAVRELKQSRRSEIHSIKSVTNEQYSEKVMKYYSMELKLKDDQIKRKRNFRENARGKFTPQIKQIQDFINANSRLVTEAILKQQFQAVIDQVVTSNVQVVARKEKEGKEDMKSLFSEWRKMKKEKIMMERTYRADKIRRGEQWRAAMASKFPNMMGVLINPFNIYAEVK